MPERPLGRRIFEAPTLLRLGPQERRRAFWPPAPRLAAWKRQKLARRRLPSRTERRASLLKQPSSFFQRERLIRRRLCRRRHPTILGPPPFCAKPRRFSFLFLLPLTIIPRPLQIQTLPRTWDNVSCRELSRRRIPGNGTLPNLLKRPAPLRRSVKEPALGRRPPQTPRFGL